jgi:hypothetical protein
VTNSSGEEEEVDRHDAMLVVATTRLTSVGGSLVLSLWSFNRPYMALSVVEGQDLGAVADFVWLKTPKLCPSQNLSMARMLLSSDPGLANLMSDSWVCGKRPEQQMNLCWLVG